MLRKISMIFILFAVALLSSSCFDAHEVDDYAYVTTIGIDKGIADKWRFTYQITNMRTTGQAAESSGSKAPEYVTLTIDAPAYFHATNALDATLARSLNFRHTKYIVIARSVAEEGEFAHVVGSIIRFREIRRTVGILVSTSTAEAFINEFNPKIGISMARLQEGLMEQAHETGFFPEMRLKEFYSSMKSPSVQPIAILAGINDFSHLPEKGEENNEPQKNLGKSYAGELPRKGGNTIEFFGTALFDGEKMVHELDGYETRVMLMLRGEYEKGIFTHKDPLDPKWDVSINLTQRRKPKVKVMFDNGKPVIHVKIMLNGDILAIQSRINYEATENIGYLETMVENTIKQEAEVLIDKAKELNIDFFNFALHAVKSFATIQEWEDYKWVEKMEDVKVIVEVDTKIRRTGTKIKNSPLITKEGKEE